MDLELGIPTFKLLTQRQARRIADKAEGVEKPLVGIGLVARRHVGPHGMPVELKAGVPNVGQSLRSACRDGRLVPGFDIGAGGKVDVLWIPA